MKIRELRSQLRTEDKAELVEILVQIYKVLPKVLIEEELIDDIIADRKGYLELCQREKEKEKRLREACREENVTSIGALQKWKNISEYARKLILNNVWCSHCRDTCGLTDYTVEPAGPDIVLRGKCPVCNHDVARYVETES